MLGRILFNLVDLFADLNEAEIKSHEDIDEWLKVWKLEVIKEIERAVNNDNPNN